MNLKKIFSVFVLLTLCWIPQFQAQTSSGNRYWMKIKASDQFQRSVIADIGAAIEKVEEDYVVAIGTLEEKNAIEKLGWMDVSFVLNDSLDFPVEDADFHNYDEMVAALVKIHDMYPTITDLFLIGLTVEGRNIYRLRISGNLAQAETLPGVIFMGGHHAREHLSVEMPLRFAQYLLAEYAAGNTKIKNLVDSRDIHIIPAVNPDGLEWDIEGGKYKLWRKNRKVNSDGTYGVDLNRNYGYKWGGSGASANPNSDTFRGTSAFSEPETQALRDYIESHVNITSLLSVHTFSQLILYPWGHTNQPISEQKDFLVHKTMAERMAKWNGYTPKQASGLYVTSGDTKDWAYGEHKIISFTFELDPGPNSSAGKGFYPGAKVIDSVVKKNIEPFLFMIEYADNPYRILDEKQGTAL